ncbi:hypothetical protein SAMN05443633_106175 [Chryseobacterium arachidis]|uniref:Uncharacterized protein n=1 Tax=Chryseobacterium arachidis TaxID=1416778 RepID=A0A1M5ED17_9FLAO|nr:hypothetical protein [Chryseobacterium arachidis]SHF76992.1 hypothetical protein SAMN05443633_106175 [Chryseobacterium arachidis]
MNTSKNNLEYQIKKQIDEREIDPSRDLWSEIQSHTENTDSKKAKLNWYLMAACLVLTVSLGAVLFFSNKKTIEVRSQMVKKGDKSLEENFIIPEKDETPILVKNQETPTEIKDNLPSGKKENKALPIAVEEKKVSVPAYRENKIEALPEISYSQPTKIIASIDSAKVPARKKKYIDPSTLLFSVEHKDVIEKTKDGSNVATIDLNIK